MLKNSGIQRVKYSKAHIRRCNDWKVTYSILQRSILQKFKDSKPRTCENFQTSKFERSTLLSHFWLISRNSLPLEREGNVGNASEKLSINGKRQKKRDRVYPKSGYSNFLAFLPWRKGGEKQVKRGSCPIRCHFHRRQRTCWREKRRNFSPYLSRDTGDAEGHAVNPWHCLPHWRCDTQLFFYSQPSLRGARVSPFSVKELPPVCYKHVTRSAWISPAP